MRHKEYTGVSSEKIINNLSALDKKAKKIILRCIMVKNVNMDYDNYRVIANTYLSLKHCIGIELIPYHTYGGSKNKQLGYEDNGRIDWIPTSDELRTARSVLCQLGCSCLSQIKIGE